MTKFIKASGAAVSIKAGVGNLYGLSITNETAAVAYKVLKISRVDS
jgi:hypothetical protein